MPAGGSAEAAAVAMAAGLVEKCARLSTAHVIGWARIAKHAGTLRRLAAVTIQSDAGAYTEYVEALRASRGRTAEVRERMTRQARGRIVDGPLKIARYAAEVADMAYDLAQHGNPNLRSDAYAALQLAAAAARAASVTLAANVRTPREDARLAEAKRLATAASALARRPAAPRRAGARGRGPARSAGSGPR